MHEELKTFRTLDLDESAEMVSAAESWLYGFIVSNTNAAARFLKVYDKAEAADETDTPVLTLRLLPTSNEHFSISNGIRFVNGISVRATTGVADNDTGAPSANDVLLTAIYWDNA